MKIKKRRIAFRGLGYNKKYLLYHPWVIVDHYLSQFRYFIQRGLYGYADEDWWSLDGYLEQWMPSALKHLKYGHGYPGIGSANTYKKWQLIVQKMIDGFEAGYYLSENFPSKNRFEILFSKQKEGLKLFIKHFNDLWD